MSSSGLKFSCLFGGCFAYYVKQGQVLMKRPLNVVSQTTDIKVATCDITGHHPLNGEQDGETFQNYQRHGNLIGG